MRPICLDSDQTTSEEQEHQLVGSSFMAWKTTFRVLYETHWI
jgi:hypothetical protein